MKEIVTLSLAREVLVRVYMCASGKQKPGELEEELRVVPKQDH
jgi:hypothetical protein